MSINRSIADLLRSHSTIPTAAAPGENLLINGAFTVAQRGTSFAITPNASGRDHDYTLDRWELDAYLVDSDYTVTRETLTPGTDEPYDHGFRHSLKVNCDVADASPAGSDLLALAQKLEGQNVQALAYGDAQAKASTVSFWHKHTKTGTHCVTVEISGGSKWTSKQYTQTTTNTWEFATVTILADTATAPASDTTARLTLFFGISAGPTITSGAEGAWGTTNGNYFPGQVNNMDNTSNNFEVAGIKWEVGSEASSYIHEDYGTTLSKASRYYERLTPNTATNQAIFQAYNVTSTVASGIFNYTHKRAAPTLTFTAGATFEVRHQTTTTVCTAAALSGSSDEDRCLCNFTVSSGLTGGQGCVIRRNDTDTTYIEVSAEL